MAEETVETIEAAEEKEIKFSRSPVSDIINDVWRGPTEEPPTLKRAKAKKPIKPKATPPREPQQNPPPAAEIFPPVEGQSAPVAIQLSGEQLLAVFDGLKLLLAKLASSDPQPLRAIYVTTGLIQGLEGVTLQKLKEMMEARSSE
jgi:hypothetical protein